MRSVVVVGAGVVGLSSAVAIQEKCDSPKVTLVAENFTNTTSHGSGGLIVPDAQGVDEEIKHFWSSEGTKYFYQLALSDKSKECGVNLISGFEFSNSNEEPYWFRYMLHCSKMSQDQLETFNTQYKNGYMYTTAVVEGPKYLSWLMNRFLANGGVCIERKISSFKELKDKYDVVVNCSGLGNRKLALDSELRPIRGQIIRVKAPWINHFYRADDNVMILPHSDTIIFGGVKQFDRTDLSSDPKDTEHIWNRITRDFPLIKGAQVQHEWVGLRAWRPKVRVEKERFRCDDGSHVTVIHNYGHGAFGVSLSWGTALSVAKLVNQHRRSPVTSVL